MDADGIDFRPRSGALLVRDQKCAQLIDSMKDGYVSQDLDGKIRECNRAFAILTGYESDDLIGMPRSAIVSAKNQNIEQQVFSEQVMARGQSGTYGQEILRKDGTMLRVEMKSFLSRDVNGVPKGIWSIMRSPMASEKLEQALDEAEARYRTLTEWLPEALVVHQDGRLVYANASAARLMGARNPAELLGKHILSFVHPDFHHIVLGRIANATANNTTMPLLRETFIRLDGGEVEVEVTTAPIAYEGNAATQVIIRDITQRVRAENKARESSLWWHTLFEHSPLPTFVWEQAGNDWLLNSHNRSADLYAGSTLRGQLGISAKKIYADSPEILGAFRRCRNEGVVRQKDLDYLVRTTGEHKVVDVTYTFIPDRYVVVTVLDETERFAALASVKHSEEHMRLIAESIPGPVSHVGGDGRYTYINRHYETWFGETREKVIGRTPREVLTKDLYAKVEPYFARVAHGETVSWETVVRTIDGREISVQVNHIPDADMSGVGRGMFTVVFDISRHAEAEQALVAALREKELLLAEVHHRVKNNLQIIASLIGIQSHAISDENTLGQLANLSLRIRAMGLLHTKLYTSSEFGRVEMRGYLTSIIEQVIATGRTSVRPVRPVINMEETWLNLETALPIGLIVNEIMTNALSHALQLACDPQIVIDFHAIDEVFHLKISDNGPGIPPDADTNRTLGLRLIEVLVRQIHGTLNIKSTSGTSVGVTFKEQKKEEGRWRK